MRLLGFGQAREPDELERWVMVALHNRMCRLLERMDKD